MTELAVLGIILLAAFAWGAYEGVLLWGRDNKSPEDDSGWLYFIGGKSTPIKVGMSKNDPAGDRIADLKTLSPFPLRVLFKMPVPDRYAAERAVHEHLAAHRKHGEWFDRDATLAFISHLKGEYK